MIIIACLCLTVFHPGLVFGTQALAESNWKLRRAKHAGAMQHQKLDSMELNDGLVGQKPNPRIDAGQTA